jgi:hypothetical protein
MTREEGVAQLKAFKSVPVPVGALPVEVGSLTEADLGVLVGLDIDSLISTLEKILPWVAVFFPALAPIIPFIPKIKDVIVLIQQLIAMFSTKEVAAMIAEAAA